MKPTVIVTGSGRGIGRATALALSAKGFAVAVNDISLEHAQAVVAEISNAGGEAIAVQGDVSSEASINNMFDTVLQKWSALTALVNNAGLVSTKAVTDLTLDEWDRVMGVNLRGVFMTCKRALTHMQGKGYGKIVNLASVAAFVGGGFLGTSCYAASKAGVIGFTKAIAREYGQFGVRANVVAPSLVDTELTSIISPENHAKVLASVPLGRIGQPEDMANVVAFLCSPESDYVSGATLQVDGGMTRK